MDRRAARRRRDCGLPLVRRGRDRTAGGGPPLVEEAGQSVGVAGGVGKGEGGLGAARGGGPGVREERARGGGRGRLRRLELVREPAHRERAGGNGMVADRFQSATSL